MKTLRKLFPSQGTSKTLPTPGVLPGKAAFILRDQCFPFNNCQIQPQITEDNGMDKASQLSQGPPNIFINSLF